MKLSVENGYIVGPGIRIIAAHSVMEAIQLGERVFVIYNYMEFPLKEPARNLFAYNFTGTQLWRAKDIGCGATDAYTGFASEKPLTVFNFACYACVIDEENGHVISMRFTK